MVSPKKSVGEIGHATLEATASGMVATLHSSQLPKNKEELEKWFAQLFVEEFNEVRPLGAAQIRGLMQNTTDDLDFTIDCSEADYLELGELNPRSESFGRDLYRTGKFNVYQYSRWVYQRIIKSKQVRYGTSVAKRTFLLLYATHWQFQPTGNTANCLRACCQLYGCEFSGVFVFITNGTNLRLIQHVWPHVLSPPRKPKDFKTLSAWNMPPATEWKLSKDGTSSVATYKLPT